MRTGLTWTPPQIPQQNKGQHEMGCESTHAGRALIRSEIPENVKEWFSAVPGRDTIPPVHVCEWLGECIRSNYRLFFGIAYGFFRDKNRAEDIVQDAVLQGLRNVARLRRPESVVGWLAKITRNACLELVRNQNDRLTGSLEEASQMAASDSVDPVQYDRQRLLLAAINNLPENQAMVVRLRFLEECDIDSIAQRLGLKRNNVEVRLHRALHRLAKNDSLKELRGTLP